MIEFSILEYREKLSEAIRRSRRAQDLTQCEVAKSAGVSERTIKVIESGIFNSLTFTTVGKVCKALKLKVRFIVQEGK